MTDQIIIATFIICSPIVVALLCKYKWIPMVMLWMLPVTKGYIASRVSLFRTLDLTVLLIILLLAMCLLSYKNLPRIRTKYVRYFLGLQIVMVLAMSVSLTWTQAPGYGLEKTLKFAVFSTIAFISPILILSNRKETYHFLYGLVFTACFVALVVILNPSFQTSSGIVVSNRTSAFESNPLNPAFFMAVSASICFLLPHRMVFLSRSFFAAVFLLLQYAVFLTSSRSMFAQAFLALSIWALLTKSELRWIFRAVVILAVIGIPAFIISDTALSSSRIGESLSNPVASYLESGRRAMWDHCFRNWIYQPFLGHGIGSFSVDFFGEDKRLFPHNIFLEALYELGLVGLCSLSGMFIVICLACRKYIKSTFYGTHQPVEKDLAIIWFSALAAATLSISLHWDLADNRLLWNMIGCMFLITLLPTEDSRKRHLLKSTIRPLYPQKQNQTISMHHSRVD